jgi:serine protease AprX
MIRERWGLLAVAALLLPAPTAQAAVPRSVLLSQQVASLRSGTAILQYSRARKPTRAALQAAGVKAVFFRKLPFVAVRGSAVRLRSAARLRGIVAAHMDRRDALQLHESVPLIYGGDPGPAWSAGFDGRGSTVAIVDSGVDGTHPDLRDRVVANVKVDDPNQLFGAGSPVYTECPVACTTDATGGHGTHVAGIVAGDGTASGGYYRGVAPGASIVGLSVGEGPAIFFELAAYDWILTHRAALNIVAVNNSFGPDAGTRYDSTAPTTVGTKLLYDAGIVVVFSAGNNGVGAREDPAGGSDCSTQRASGGGREATSGTCQINAYSVAPWVLSVANGRKDSSGGPGDQPLAYSSSRGDPVTETSIDGQPVDYLPTITAPGTNIRSARALGGTTTPLSCGSAEPPACLPPPEALQYEPSYMVLSGTSMAAPHVAGAVAVVQSAAKKRLGRLLTPAEVRSVLTASADRMTKTDSLWDWPCGSTLFQPCGGPITGTTGKPYERWQVGAGYLDVAGAVRAVDALQAAPDAGAPPKTDSYKTHPRP